jgi:hypothetical protein
VDWRWSKLTQKQRSRLSGLPWVCQGSGDGTDQRGIFAADLDLKTLQATASQPVPVLDKRLVGSWARF